MGILTGPVWRRRIHQTLVENAAKPPHILLEFRKQAFVENKYIFKLLESNYESCVYNR